ncbi:MAG: radical SAM protein [Candidatus Omnitrophota bacterium]
MANVLLISPSQKVAYGKIKAPVQIHMGLAYLAAVLEKDKHNVRIIDIDAEALSPDDFKDVIRLQKYDIAGFTATTPTLSSSLELARLVKKESPGTLTVFGGIHPTIEPRETINFDCVDVVVIGEGEITLKELAGNIGSTANFAKIAGLMYKREGQIEETPKRGLIEDLDSLPFPARHLFKKQVYTYPDSLYRKTAPMFTSRGCPGMCTYCNAHQIFKRVCRTRSAGNVVDEIEYLVRRIGAKEVHIWDDNFTTIKKRVFEIRDEILKRGLKVKFAFPNGIRSDFLNIEIMKALKDMGTYSIALGVESGSQEVLNKARKGIKLEKVEEIFALAKDMKLETWAFFIFGLPGETKDTIRQTIDFAKRMDPDVAKFHILKPYPGTDVYDYLKSRNLILTEDRDQFGIHTPPIHRLESLEPADMVQWQKRAYGEFYLRPGKIVHQILRIKTLNRFVVNAQAAISLVKMTLFKG